MSGIKTMLAILQGRAIVMIKKDEHRVDVQLGKDISKQFAINSMAGAVKTLLA